MCSSKLVRFFGVKGYRSHNILFMLVGRSRHVLVISNWFIFSHEPFACECMLRLVELNAYDQYPLHICTMFLAISCLFFCFFSCFSYSSQVHTLFPCNILCYSIFRTAFFLMCGNGSDRVELMCLSWLVAFALFPHVFFAYLPQSIISMHFSVFFFFFSLDCSYLVK